MPERKFVISYFSFSHRKCFKLHNDRKRCNVADERTRNVISYLLYAPNSCCWQSLRFVLTLVVVNLKREQFPMVKMSTQHTKSTNKKYDLSQMQDAIDHFFFINVFIFVLNLVLSNRIENADQPNSCHIES